MASRMKQIKAIKRAIRTENLSELRRLAIKHGFISDKLRKKAWSLILGIETNADRIINERVPSNNVDPIESYQIEQDIKRTPFDYCTLKTKTDEQKYRGALGKILHTIFDSNEDMHYLQGFNDVTSVLYAVCNNIKLAHSITKKVAQTSMSDFILADDLNFASTKLIFGIIDSNDQKLSEILQNEHHDFIAISISWLITWFAHQITDINLISRIYDYCLCAAPNQMICSYLSAALLLYLKHEIFRAKKNEMTLFEFFQELEWNKINFNQIIAMCELLFHQHAKSMADSYSYLSDSSESPSITTTPMSYAAESLQAPSTLDLWNEV